MTKVTSTDMPPCGLPTVFWVLYCFAGRERRSDLCEVLKEALEAKGEAMKRLFHLRMEEIDTERGGDDHDLTLPERQERLLGRVKQGELIWS